MRYHGPAGKVLAYIDFAERLEPLVEAAQDPLAYRAHAQLLRAVETLERFATATCSYIRIPLPR